MILLALSIVDIPIAGAAKAAAAASTGAWRTCLDVPGWNDVDSVFRRFDRDGSGDISVKELRGALRQLAVRLDTELATEILNEFDQDENGSLSVPEFKRLVARLQEIEQRQPQGLTGLNTKEAARALFAALPVWHTRQNRGAVNNEVVLLLDSPHALLLAPCGRRSLWSPLPAVAASCGRVSSLATSAPCGRCALTNPTFAPPRVQVRKLIGEGRLDEAEDALRRSVAACRTSLGEAHPHTLNAQSGLAVTLWQRGRLDESERLQRLTLQAMEATLGGRHADTRTVRDNLAVALRQRGKTEEADALLEANREKWRGGGSAAALLMVGLSIM